MVTRINLLYHVLSQADHYLIKCLYIDAIPKLSAREVELDITLASKKTVLDKLSTRPDFNFVIINASPYTYIPDALARTLRKNIGGPILIRESTEYTLSGICKSSEEYFDYDSPPISLVDVSSHTKTIKLNLEVLLEKTGFLEKKE